MPYPPPHWYLPHWSLALWQPAVPTHAPWHHRSSSSLSRSTETLPPRGAMATSRVDTYVPESPYCTYGLRVPARPACLRTKGAGQLAPVPHALYVRCTRTSLGRAVRTAYRVPWHTLQATSMSTSPRSTSCRSSRPSSRSARAPPTGERDAWELFLRVLSRVRFLTPPGGDFTIFHGDAVCHVENDEQAAASARDAAAREHVQRADGGASDARRASVLAPPPPPGASVLRR